MKQAPVKQNRIRRSYSKSFKAELVAQSLAKNESIAAIALGHGINANLLQRWIREHERYGHHSLDEIQAKDTDRAVATGPANWIPLVSSPQTSRPHRQAAMDVSIALSGRDGIQIQMHWPGGDVQGLARFARELLT